MAKTDKPELVRFSGYSAVELMSLITADMNLTIEQVEAIERGAKVVRDRTEAERLEKAHKELEAVAAKYGISKHQLWFKGATAKGRKLPVKYKDDKGNTWTGQGAKPKWMGDKDPSEFRVVAEAAE